MKKRIRQFTAAFAAMTMLLGAMPSTAMADGNYTAYNDTTTVPENLTNVPGQGKTYIDDKNRADLTKNDISNDAILTKSLVIEEDANIPNAVFTYKVESPTNVNNYAGNDAKYLVKTTDGNNPNVSIMRGINADKIQVRSYDTDDKTVGNSVSYTVAASGTDTSALYKQVGTITLNYNEQQMVQTAANDGSKWDVSSKDDNGTELDDDVSIVNYKQNGTEQDNKYYTANKSMLLDFTKCGFTEPGIYRYYITESSETTGVTLDGNGADTEGNPVRTLDVYVEDDTTVSAGVTTNALKITGYVLYEGKQVGPAYSVEQTAGVENAATVTVDGSSTVQKNGYEVSGAKKSSGWQNTYETVNLTVGKKVIGNQGSKDKFFKYTVKIKGASANDKFTVEVSQKTTGTAADIETSIKATGEDNDGYINVATKYANNIIWGGTTATNPYNNTTTSFVVNGTTDTVYTVYLRNGDYVTLTGIPVGASYTIEEDKEDYTQTFYKGKTDDASTALAKIKDLLVAENLTSYTAETDSSGISTSTVIGENKDLEFAFVNEKKGTIPTGIIMSVAPAVIVGIGVLAAIFALVLGGKKKELDEE